MRLGRAQAFKPHITPVSLFLPKSYLCLLSLSTVATVAETSKVNSLASLALTNVATVSEASKMVMATAMTLSNVATASEHSQTTATGKSTFNAVATIAPISTLVLITRLSLAAFAQENLAVILAFTTHETLNAVAHLVEAAVMQIPAHMTLASFEAAVVVGAKTVYPTLLLSTVQTLTESTHVVSHPITLLNANVAITEHSVLQMINRLNLGSVVTMQYRHSLIGLSGETVAELLITHTVCELTGAKYTYVTII